MDGELRLVDPPQLFRARVHVHQGLTRARYPESRIATGGDIAQARTDGDEQVALGQRLDHARRGRQPEVAGVIRVQIVDVVLTPERVGDRQVVTPGKLGDVRACLRRPVATAHHQQRPLAGG